MCAQHFLSVVHHLMLSLILHISVNSSSPILESIEIKSWASSSQNSLVPTKSPSVVDQSKSKSVLSLESPSKSYPYVGKMTHICRQNESRRTEM